MQRGILHTHLCLQRCLRSLAGGQEHGPTGEHEELVPSLTLVMYSVPKDSLRGLTVSPLPLSHLPSACSPQAHDNLQTNTLVILHPFFIHPVAFLPHPALLSAPPWAAPLLHQLLFKARPHYSSLAAGPQGPGFGSLSFAQALSPASASSRTPLVLLQISFPRQELQQSVALQRH